MDVGSLRVVGELGRRPSVDAQRLLLVHTPGTGQYGRTRGFYLRCGYDAEASIRDDRENGDDLAVFRKAP